MKNRERFMKEAKKIDMYLEATKYEEKMVDILACDTSIKSLDAQIKTAQEILDK